MNIQILQPHQYIHFCVLQSSQVCSCCTRWIFEWVTSVSAYVKYCLVYVGKVFPLEPDPFHSHWFSDKFSFLHNRVGEMTQKWPKQLTAFTSASKENKRWEVTCSDIVAWFVQWENAGGGWLDEQTETDRSETRNVLMPATRPTWRSPQNWHVCSEMLRYTGRNSWASERTNWCRYGPVNEKCTRINEWMDHSMSDQINKWMTEQMSEWTAELHRTPSGSGLSPRAAG